MKKYISAAFVFALISGCGEEAHVEPTIAPKNGSQESVVSKTTIYLPGGAGLDFGREPETDRESEYSEGKRARSIIFLFPDSIESVSAAVDKVLLEQGYSKKTTEHKSYIKHDVYIKGDKSVAFAYNRSVSEGFSDMTKLVIWHKL